MYGILTSWRGADELEQVSYDAAELIGCSRNPVLRAARQGRVRVAQVLVPNHL